MSPFQGPSGTREHLRETENVYFNLISVNSACVFEKQNLKKLLSLQLEGLMYRVFVQGSH